MKKASLTVTVDLTPNELWDIFHEVKEYPRFVPFMTKAEIHNPLRLGTIWYDITTILFYPVRVRHTVDIYDPLKEIGFFCELPFDGKMYQRFSLEKVDKDTTKVTGEITFHLGDPVVTLLLGPFLKARLQAMLFGMFQSAQKVVKAKRRREKNPIFVSVVIPAYNEEKLIAQTLKSLQKQTYKHFEVIVADNNSTDNTAAIAKQLGAKVVPVKKKGVGITRQSGFMEARGEIIASTDADTILPTNWLSRIVDYFQEDPTRTAVGGYSTLYSGPWTAKLIIKYLSYPFIVLDRLVSGGWNLCGFNMAVRKDAFLLSGGFDTSLMIGEDIDISEKMRKLGLVTVEKDLTVQVSGRRYEKGYLRGVLDYVPHFFSRVLLRKVMVNSFRDVR